MIGCSRRSRVGLRSISDESLSVAGQAVKVYDSEIMFPVRERLEDHGRLANGNFKRKVSKETCKGHFNRNLKKKTVL